MTDGVTEAQKEQGVGLAHSVLFPVCPCFLSQSTDMPWFCYHSVFLVLTGKESLPLSLLPQPEVDFGCPPLLISTTYSETSSLTEAGAAH